MVGGTVQYYFWWYNVYVTSSRPFVMWLVNRTQRYGISVAFPWKSTHRWEATVKYIQYNAVYFRIVQYISVRFPIKTRGKAT